MLARLREGNNDVRELLASDSQQAADLASDAVAAGAYAVVALGGDGTVHLALQAVAGTPTALGIVAVGTGNDAARMLGLPRGRRLPDALAAADVVLAGRTRRIDVGRVGASGRCFLTVLAAGFDSRVNERANAMRWPHGRARYDAAMLAELRVFRPIPFVVGLDPDSERSEDLTTPAMLVAIGNGPSYGGGMRVCPAADPSDGLLDVTILTPLSTAAFVRVFPSVYRGDHVRHPAVLTRRARTVSLALAPSRGPAPLQLTAFADGEPMGPLPLTVVAVPGAVDVLV